MLQAGVIFWLRGNWLPALNFSNTPNDSESKCQPKSQALSPWLIGRIRVGKWMETFRNSCAMDLHSTSTLNSKARVSFLTQKAWRVLQESLRKVKSLEKMTSETAL